MAKIFRAIFFAAALLVVVAGCGDEGCPNCSADTSKRVSVTGLVMFASDVNVYAAIDIMSISGETWPEIDSLTVMGRKVDLLTHSYDETPVFIVRQEISDPVYSAGDIINIVAYTPFGTDTCRICLLDYYEDVASFYGWTVDPPYDTVDVGEGFEVAWSSQPLADGYRFRVTYVYDSTGWNTRGQDLYDTDTVFSVQGDQSRYNGYWLFYVAPAAGMRPDGSIASASGSGAVIWNVACRTEYAELTIYVGTGDPGGDI